MAVNNLDVNTLRTWLTNNKALTVLDVRPSSQRIEWYIPGSIHVDIYDRLRAGDPDALAGVELDRSIPVVVVCAAGKTSQVAADLLNISGLEAYSLEGGMKSWSMAWNSVRVTFENFEVIQIRRTGKGCLSYIVVSGGKAIVIDASLPTEVYQHILIENGWQLQAVIDTHVHADHLSRARTLVTSSFATLFLPENSNVQFPFEPLTHDRAIELGTVKLQAIATPGHTLENIALLLDNKVLFSGDTLFTNSIGRPDLKADETETRFKTGLLFDSLKKLLQLDAGILVLPGHTNTPVNFDHQVIGEKLGIIDKQLALVHLPKEKFIETVVAKTPLTPPNYMAIVERNLTGIINETEAVELEAGANRCAI